MFDTELVLLVAGVAVAIVLGLLLWGVKCPVVWRLLSALAVGSGVGVLVWGITAASLGEQPWTGSPTALMGAGAGVMSGGIMLLIISFSRSTRCK